MLWSPFFGGKINIPFNQLSKSYVGSGRVVNEQPLCLFRLDPLDKRVRCCGGLEGAELFGLTDATDAHMHLVFKLLDDRLEALFFEFLDASSDSGLGVVGEAAGVLGEPGDRDDEI